jgi:hypothetical protein
MEILAHFFTLFRSRLPALGAAMAMAVPPMAVTMTSMTVAVTAVIMSMAMTSVIMSVSMPVCMAMTSMIVCMTMTSMIMCMAMPDYGFNVLLHDFVLRHVGLFGPLECRRLVMTVAMMVVGVTVSAHKRQQKTKNHQQT